MSEVETAYDMAIENLQREAALHAVVTECYRQGVASDEEYLTSLGRLDAASAEVDLAEYALWTYTEGGGVLTKYLWGY